MQKPKSYLNSRVIHIDIQTDYNMYVFVSIRTLPTRTGGWLFFKRGNVRVNRFLDRPTDETRSVRNGVLPKNSR